MQKMPFVLTGFTQDMGFRVFGFRRVGVVREAEEYSVRADLALIRRYGIQVQELPLLCRRLLEKRDEQDLTHLLTFTEAEMATHVRDSAAARETAAQKRKPPRKPPSENVGWAWRGRPSE